MARRIVLVGHPVRHSLSPVFQQAAMRAAGLDAVYEAVDVPPEALAGVIAQLRADRAAGNVTVPHKAQVAALCDRLTPRALAP
jgi:shikimate dehydrogenase